jgi:hypothetical protein
MSTIAYPSLKYARLLKMLAFSVLDMLPLSPSPIAAQRMGDHGWAMAIGMYERSRGAEDQFCMQRRINTSRRCASLTTRHSSGSSCSQACFNSLIIRAANLRASSSSCRLPAVQEENSAAPTAINPASPLSQSRGQARVLPFMRIQRPRVSGTHDKSKGLKLQRQ